MKIKGHLLDLFAETGLCGVMLYFLLQNEALVFTQASNAGVIISVAPFFTALFVRMIYNERCKAIR